MGIEGLHTEADMWRRNPTHANSLVVYDEMRTLEDLPVNHPWRVFIEKKRAEFFAAPKKWVLISAIHLKETLYFTYPATLPQAVAYTPEIAAAVHYESESHAQTAAIILEQKGYAFMVHNTAPKKGGDK